MDRNTKAVLRDYLDDLPPTQDTVDRYRTKLEKCRKEYDVLLHHLES